MKLLTIAILSMLLISCAEKKEEAQPSVPVIRAELADLWLDEDGNFLDLSSVQERGIASVVYYRAKTASCEFVATFAYGTITFDPLQTRAIYGQVSECNTFAQSTSYSLSNYTLLIATPSGLKSFGWIGRGP